jgi:hypothetical protein
MALLKCDILTRVGGYVPAGFEGRLNDQMNIIHMGCHQEVAPSLNDMRHTERKSQWSVSGNASI